MTRLIAAAEADGRLSEVLGALGDDERIENLYAEYGIGLDPAVEDADTVKM